MGDIDIMAKRRGNQDGTFYQRANGTWCGQVMIDNKRYTVYAKGIQECRKKLREKINEVEVASTDNVLFSVYAHSAIEKQVLTKEIKRSTADVKLRSINDFIGSVGDYPLKDINRDIINRFSTILISRGCMYNTIKTRILYVLSIMTIAYNEGVVDFKIPSGAINFGPKWKKEVQLPTLQQVKTLIESYKQEDRKTFLYILLYAGLRSGECAGLKWSDIDLDDNKIYINRGVYRTDAGEIIMQAPKGNRLGEYAQFSDTLHNILVHYKDTKKPNKNDYLFDYTGKTAVSRMVASFSRRLRMIGCKGGLHVLRHLHASILLSNGIDLKTIQCQLRHADINTTDKYLHELETDIRSSIRKLVF
jgi:integrase